MSMGGELTNGWSLFAENSGDVSAAARSDQSASSNWRALKSALLLGAASCIAYPASAQQAPDAVPLPQLNVEASAKKKAAAKKSAPKKAPVAAQVQPAPEPQPPQPVAGIIPDGAATPGGNPYANPNAPYNVERSASGKFTEPLLNTPKTVTAVPKEVMEDQGVRDLRELARNVPGLTIGTAEGGNAFGAFAVRGFKANNDIFMDGLRNPGNTVPDIFGIEQVEIYKGPSGGIAGRSTIGGAINLITKQPDLNFNHYELATTIGTDDTFRSTIDVNQVVTHDFAVRANLMYDQHDVSGRDITDSERWGGLLSATARVTEDLKVTLDYYHYTNEAIPDWGVPVLTRSNAASLAAGVPAGAIHKPITEFGYPRDMFVGMRGLDYFNERADIGTSIIQYKITEGLTLTNKSRIGESAVEYVATSMEGIPDVHHPNRDQTAEFYGNQTELNAKFTTGTFKHDVVAGLELSREKIHRSNITVTNCYDNIAPAASMGCPQGAVARPRPFPPNPYSPIDKITGRPWVYDATIDTAGLYILDTVHLSDQLIVNGGVRYDDFERDQVGLAAANTAKVQADLFSWNVGVVYKPIPISSFYAAYGTSESPIGSELDATGPEYNGLSAALVQVKPQEARAVEVGTKWELFDRRLLATAALFQTDVENARTNPNANTIGTRIDRAYAGEYRVRGIELGAAGNITKDWSVFGGLVLLDTEVLKSDDLNPQDVGRRLANIPLAQFSLMSRYQLTKDFALGGTATYGGEVYAGHLAANASNNHTVDWWRFDAFAEYEISKNWEIEVSGLNLTDELYYDAIYQAPGITGNDNGTFAFVAPGRAGYLTVKWKYD
jgi:catecholate siderophore receptor